MSLRVHPDLRLTSMHEPTRLESDRFTAIGFQFSSDLFQHYSILHSHFLLEQANFMEYHRSVSVPAPQGAGPVGPCLIDVLSPSNLSRNQSATGSSILSSFGPTNEIGS